MKTALRFFGKITFFLLALGMVALLLLFTGLADKPLKAILQKLLNKWSAREIVVNSLSFSAKRFSVNLSTGTAHAEIKGRHSFIVLGEPAGTYSVTAKDIGDFKDVTGLPVQGPLSARGEFKGKPRDIVITGDARFCKGAIRYEARVKNFDPLFIKADAEGIDTLLLLYALKLPHIVQGTLDFKADLRDPAGDAPAGTLKADLKGILCNTKLMGILLGKDLPTTPFSARMDSTLDKESLKGAVDFDSGIASIRLENFSRSNKTEEMAGSFDIHIPDLAKLRFLTGMRLRGEVSARGDASYKKGTAEIRGLSNLCGGAVDFHFKGEKIHARFSEIQTAKLLETLEQDPLFQAVADGNADYDAGTRRGTLNAVFKNGRFKGEVFEHPLLSLAGVAVEKELYRDSTLESVMADGVIASNLAMKSRNTKIRSDNAIINAAEKTIDATIRIIIKSMPLTVKLTGSLEDPDKSVEVGEYVNKGIEMILDKDPKSTVNRLKSLFDKIRE